MPWSVSPIQTGRSTPGILIYASYKAEDFRAWALLKQPIQRTFDKFLIPGPGWLAQPQAHSGGYTFRTGPGSGGENSVASLQTSRRALPRMEPSGIGARRTASRRARLAGSFGPQLPGGVLATVLAPWTTRGIAPPKSDAMAATAS